MRNISKEEFETMEKNGVFVFHSSHCFTCEEHIKTMSEKVVYFYLIETGEDVDYFESIGIRLTPHTRLYKNNEVVWKDQGAFYNLQIENLRNERIKHGI